ncbi:hypothetical protein PAHAL_1G206100 [Panicum hallii]|jgi:hypothetical protein|uniref:Uncharacterized protein n=1 Tax=Panicum hallii TaxID=206008 RepID=A0A2T8KVX3_9POAL|nr:hypothetical protein PAHAL_1G206100 [Panicum hallii]
MGRFAALYELYICDQTMKAKWPESTKYLCIVVFLWVCHQRRNTSVFVIAPRK